MAREKRCGLCKELKPLTVFGRRSVSPDGRHPWCKPCERAYRRRWTEANREAYRESQRAYRRRNRKRLRQYNRDYQRRRRALMRLGKWGKPDITPELAALASVIERRLRTKAGGSTSSGRAEA